MCVIIHKPMGVKLTEDLVMKSWNGNPHGAGFISIKGNEKTLIGKGYMTYPEFQKVLYEEGLITEEIESILHFRIATHGGVNRDNCHPFYDLEKNIALCHNGILREFGSKDLSDTKDLFESVIRKVNSQARVKVLESLAGYDKFILFNEGTIYRFGEWVEYGGCFYSNDFSLPYVPVIKPEVANDLYPSLTGTTTSSLKYCDECRLACVGGYRESEGYYFCDDCYNDWFGQINGD